ncbi:hypothetical protein [Sphingomonas corticis]|jgi:VanZ family protein|uniref:VanZ family protein n=1 Tax=Sphingomonas corticis TaxID=2722791 RepID=A0ABX1CJS2_9SPHN|nr:hypothetical protein [Sphingomonas corticis]NJR78239.1 hypothetical protein [Sphingomonas corticis]
MVARLARILLVAALIGAVAMALTPRPPSLHVGDKWQHMAAFGTLTILAVAGFPRSPLHRIGERLSFLGALIEVFQSIPAIGRDCDVMDWLADTYVIVGVLIVVRIVRGPSPASRASASTP